MMFHRRKFALVVSVILFSSGAALAESKRFSWTDPNFVPCEGLGLTASGRITADAEYSMSGETVDIKIFHLHTDYQHAHEPTATLRFTKPDGSQGTTSMQKAWFATIGPDDGSKDLYLPRAGDAAGADGQTPFQMKAGTAVEISLSTLFPQDGGNCVASFYDTLVLP